MTMSSWTSRTTISVACLSDAARAAATATSRLSGSAGLRAVAVSALRQAVKSFPTTIVMSATPDATWVTATHRPPAPPGALRLVHVLVAAGDTIWVVRTSKRVRVLRQRRCGIPSATIRRRPPRRRPGPRAVLHDDVRPAALHAEPLRHQLVERPVVRHPSRGGRDARRERVDPRPRALTGSIPRPGLEVVGLARHRAARRRRREQRRQHDLPPRERVRSVDAQELHDLRAGHRDLARSERAVRQRRRPGSSTANPPAASASRARGRSGPARGSGRPTRRPCSTARRASPRGRCRRSSRTCPRRARGSRADMSAGIVSAGGLPRRPVPTTAISGSAAPRTARRARIDARPGRSTRRRRARAPGRIGSGEPPAAPDQRDGRQDDGDRDDRRRATGGGVRARARAGRPRRSAAAGVEVPALTGRAPPSRRSSSRPRARGSGSAAPRRTRARMSVERDGERRDVHHGDLGCWMGASCWNAARS